MSVYGLRHAVIGGKFGEWRLRDKPKTEEAARVGQYFQEDKPVDLIVGKDAKVEGPWVGTGRFRLPDFCKLTEFLNDLTSSEGTASPLQPS